MTQEPAYHTASIQSSRVNSKGGTIVSAGIGGEQAHTGQCCGDIILSSKNEELVRLFMQVHEERDHKPFRVGKEPASKLTDLELIATVLYHKNKSNPHHWVDFRDNGHVENRFGVNPQFEDGRSSMGASAVELAGDYYDVAPELARRFLELRAAVVEISECE